MPVSKAPSDLSSQICAMPKHEFDRVLSGCSMSHEPLLKCLIKAICPLEDKPLGILRTSHAEEEALNRVARER